MKKFIVIIGAFIALASNYTFAARITIYIKNNTTESMRVVSKFTTTTLLPGGKIDLSIDADNPDFIGVLTPAYLFALYAPLPNPTAFANKTLTIENKSSGFMPYIYRKHGTIILPNQTTYFVSLQHLAFLPFHYGSSPVV